MKILIFSTAYLPFIGGAEVSVKELTDRLGDEIHFDLLTTRLSGELPTTEKIGKVNIYRIGFGIPLLDKLLVPFWGAFKTLSLQRQNHYDAYWCIMATFASGAAYIANWFQKRVPVILTLQEGDSEEWLRHRWFGLLDLSWRMALKRTQILTALSVYLLERGKRLGFKGEGVLVPNGVEVERFINEHPRPVGDEVVLLTVSRLVVKNGVEDVIRSMAFMPDNFKLKIAGTGFLEKKLRSLVSELKLESRVEFLGLVSQDELPALLHSADIFIRPSLSEGQGISFIEAMAAGLPVIATPVGGIPDFLKDGETGLMVEPKNPRQIAFQAQKLVSDRVLRDKITINAKRMVVEKYDWALIAKEMKERVFAKVEI